MATQRTARGFDRLVNFTDAAVAIALTLLVLPLVDLGPEAAKESLGHVFAAHWQNILAFVISFAVIGNLWLVHHRIFELAGDYDYRLAVLDLAWLATITALPFTTNVIANASGSPAVLGLYLGNIFAASALALALRVYLSRHPQLLRPEIGPELHVAAAAVPTGILLVVVVLAVLFPSIGSLWLLLMFAGSPIERAIIRHQGAQEPDTTTRTAPPAGG
jgi:uncharacterized membrane protein